MFSEKASCKVKSPYGIVTSNIIYHFGIGLPYKLKDHHVSNLFHFNWRTYSTGNNFNKYRKTKI